MIEGNGSFLGDAQRVDDGDVLSMRIVPVTTLRLSVLVAEPQDDGLPEESLPTCNSTVLVMLLDAATQALHVLRDFAAKRRREGLGRKSAKAEYGDAGSDPVGRATSVAVKALGGIQVPRSAEDKSYQLPC